ncbi:hypothetical protein D3C72_2047800 [compost metagenome]
MAVDRQGMHPSVSVRRVVVLALGPGHGEEDKRSVGRPTCHLDARKHAARLTTLHDKVEVRGQAAAGQARLGSESPDYALVMTSV